MRRMWLAVPVLAIAAGVAALTFSPREHDGVLAQGTPPAAMQAPACANPPPAIGGTAVTANSALASALGGLGATIEAARQSSALPSIAVGVVLDQELIFAAGFGCADITLGIPATPQTLYRLGSTGKLFAAIMTMQLRDAGKLQLADAVNMLVPEVYYKDTNGATISPTFQELASHSAGLPDQMPSGLSTVPQFWDYLHTLTASFQPGTQYSYSDVGYVTLEQAGAAVAGSDYHDYVQQQIFVPLGMTSSTYDYDTIAAGQLAVPYNQLRMMAGMLTGVPAPTTNPFPPSGQVASSVVDMAKFMAMFFGTGPAGGAQILAPASIQEMYQPVIQTPGAGAVGIGWFIYPYGNYTLVSKNGGWAGVMTMVRMIPELKLGIVTLINLSPQNVSGAASPAKLDQTIFSALLPALGAQP